MNKTDEAAKAELDALRARTAKLEALLGEGPRPGRQEPAEKPKRRRMSAAARAAISRAQKARWAKKKAPAGR